MTARQYGPTVLPPPVRSVMLVALTDERDTHPDVAGLVNTTPITESNMSSIEQLCGDGATLGDPAKLLLDKLATGSDFRSALDVAAKLASSIPRAKTSPLDVPIEDEDDIASDVNVDLVKTRAAETPDVAPNVVKAQADYVKAQRVAPRTGDIKITAARSTTSTFLRTTFAHGLVTIRHAPAALQQQVDVVAQLMQEGTKTADTTPAATSLVPLHEDINHPADLMAFYATRIAPHVRPVWDAEDCVLVFTGTTRTSRVLNILLPPSSGGTASALQAAATGFADKGGRKPSFSSGLSRPVSSASNLTPSGGGGGPARSYGSMLRRAASRAMSPTAPLEGRFSPVRRPSPDSNGRPGAGRATSPLSAKKNVTVAPTASSDVYVKPDFSTLECLLVDLLREGRGRAITPSYDVRIWVSVLRCSATEPEGRLDDMFATTDRAIISDSIGTGTPNAESRAAEKAAAEKAAAEAAATAAGLVATSTPQPEIVIKEQRRSSFVVHPTVVPSPSGFAAVVANSLHLFPVQTKRDAESVARRTAKFLSQEHHAMITITVQQDCPLLPIPSRKASIRIFIAATAANDKTAPFSSAELDKAFQKLCRAPVRAPGVQPPLASLFPLMPTAKRAPKCTSYLDLMATSLNHTPVAHLLCTICGPMRSFGTVMPTIALSTGYPLTTEIGDVNDGVLQTLAELLDDYMASDSQIERLTDDLRKLQSRGFRRQSTIHGVVSDTERVSSEAYETSVRVERANSVNSPRKEATIDDDDQLGQSMDLAEVLIVSKGEVTLPPRPPSSRAAGAANSRLSARIAPQGVAGSEHSGGPTSQRPTPSLKSSDNRLTMSHLLTLSKQLSRSDEYDDDDGELSGDALRTISRQQSEQANRKLRTGEAAAIAERNSARDKVDALRKRVEWVKQEIIRRRNEHEHAMRSREADHAREVAQYNTESLLERLEKKGPDLGFEEVQLSFHRNEAMEAKATRAADRVRSEAFQSVQTTNAAKEARLQANLEETMRQLTQEYVAVLRLTRRPPMVYVAPSLRDEVERRLISGIAPDGRRASSDDMNDNKSRVAQLLELSFLTHTVSQTYQALHSTVAAMWRRGEFLDAEARRRCTIHSDVSPLQALESSLKSETWSHTIMRSANRKFVEHRSALRDQKSKAEQRAPSVLGASREGPRVLAIDKELPHPSLVTFGESLRPCNEQDLVTPPAEPLTPPAEALAATARLPRNKELTADEAASKAPLSARRPTSKNASGDAALRQAFVAMNRIAIRSAHRDETTAFTPREYEKASRSFAHRSEQ